MSTYCTSDLALHGLETFFSKMQDGCNIGNQMRNKGKLDAALQIYEECLHTTEQKLGLDSPFVAPILKSMMILQFDHIGGLSGSAAAVKLAHRAIGNFMNGINCERAGDADKLEFAEQVAMICDYKSQAEIKLGRFSDAMESQKMAIKNMEFIGLTDHPKFKELKIMNLKMKQKHVKMQQLSVKNLTNNKKKSSKNNKKNNLKTGEENRCNMIPSDAILCHVVSQWLIVDTKSHGTIQKETQKRCNIHDSSPETILSISLKSPQPGYMSPIRTVSNFIRGSTEDVSKSKTKSAALCKWFARMKLRYSCSTINCAFVHFVVPELIRQNISHLLVDGSQPIDINDIVVCTVFFKPTQRHMVEYSVIDCVNLPPNVLQKVIAMDPVELKRDHPEIARLMEKPPAQEIIESNLLHTTHQVLKCNKTGVIMDLSGGQFIGSMQPAVFLNLQSFEASIPGEIVHFMEAPEHEIQEQLSRDSSSPHGAKAVKSKVWVPRAVNNAVAGLTDGKYWETICRGCLGTPKNVKKLKRCHRCERVLYCCRACQINDWKRHRKECKHL